MAIAREDLERLGFKQVGPTEKGHWRHEVWYYGECGHVWVGYDQEGTAHKLPAIDGDKDNLIKVCMALLGNAQEHIRNLEREDDCNDDDW